VTPAEIKARAEQVKLDFASRGVPISSWADQHNYRRTDVYRVLNGFSACRRGLQHEIAVKLGIKPAPQKQAA
jgi:gp16 family phage-associated protein